MIRYEHREATGYPCKEAILEKGAKEGGGKELGLPL